MTSSILTWISGVIERFWLACMQVVSACLQFVADLLMAVLNLGVDFLFWIITGATALLLPVPDLPGGGTLTAPFLGFINYFFPLNEFFQGLTFIATVYAAVWLYKGAKFIRGAG